MNICGGVHLNTIIPCTSLSTLDERRKQEQTPSPGNYHSLEARR